ncbi:MFS superfamily sulfate permease-like transporter [Luteibacter sp. HA06]
MKPSSRLRQEWLGNVRSDKNRECMGQGIANVATGFIGSMAGCWCSSSAVKGSRSRWWG